MRLLIPFLLAPFFLFAQQKYILTGSVTEKGSITIPGASVFIEGTTMGTQADANGLYTLKNIPAGRHRLVASLVGYLPKMILIDVPGKSSNWNFSLEEDNKTLDEVRVVGSQDKTWEKQFRAFERGFIGESYDRKEVYITNREVVDFTEDDDAFNAKASKPLQIVNKTLGYKVTYFMDNFEKTSNLTSFKGLASFEKLIPEDAKQERRWERNREEAYEGSIKHFLKALVGNRLEEEGFNAFLLKPEYLNNLRRGLFFDRNNERHVAFKEPDLIGVVSEEGLTTMNWKIPMEIVFNRKRVARPIFMDAPYPYTILIPKGPIQVTAAGDLMNPYSIEMREEMGKIGMADLLPLDFEINTEK
ncbi:carboxypeptidase-like regulatory domain-containing protein [Aquirufa sp. A-Brett2-W8]